MRQLKITKSITNRESASLDNEALCVQGFKGVARMMLDILK